MNALKSIAVSESWNCSKDNGAAAGGKRHLLWSPAYLILDVVIKQWGDHIKTLSLTIKWPKLFCGLSCYSQLCFCPLINSLIMTLRRAHQTNYRDGVSDYIRLLVYCLWQRLVYRLDLQCGVYVYMSMWACAVCVSAKTDMLFWFQALLTKSE